MVTKSEVKIKKEQKSALGGKDPNGAPVSQDKIKKLTEAGVHFGHKKEKWHPSMASYIFALRNNIYIIDLEKTVELLDRAKKFLKGVLDKKGVILFVGSGPAAERLARETAEKLNMPYVAGRWLGGTLTNFKTITKRLEYFRDLEKKEKAGELKKYTKKEQADFREELRSLQSKFGGIKNMTGLPDVLFVFSLATDNLAVKEAKKSGISVIGIADTNANPELADYPIPANDDAIPSLKLISQEITKK